MSITPLRSDTLLAAQKIARSLSPAEDTIDNGILAGSGLLTSIITGRLQSNSSLCVAHDAVLEAYAMLGSLVEARSRALNCHELLAGWRDSLHLRADDVGCTGDKHITGVSPAPSVVQAA